MSMHSVSAWRSARCCLQGWHGPEENPPKITLALTAGDAPVVELGKLLGPHGATGAALRPARADVSVPGRTETCRFWMGAESVIANG
jgi:hypothetical protein